MSDIDVIDRIERQNAEIARAYSAHRSQDFADRLARLESKVDRLDKAVYALADAVGKLIDEED